MTTAIDALEQLREGNRRYLAGHINSDGVNSTRRQQLVDGQFPIAVIIGCSDSRVPVEHIFNQGLGDLFVIRVAGNVIAPTLVGSAEFAVQKFGVRLVVVLGHTKCGAVAAVVNTRMADPPVPASSEPSPNIRMVLDRIHAGLESVSFSPGDDDDTKIQIAVRKNIDTSIEHLLDYSELFKQMVDSGELMVVGAQYDIETGEVEFFDEMPR